jgi:type I restriction enzyme M protein
VIDDPHLLSHYELTTWGSNDARSVLPAEQLFVEGAWKYVKPGGRLAIVLPDSILNNPSLQFIRDWLFRRSRVVASIDLPKETFAESGGVPNPSVLIVKKLTREEMRLAERDALEDYPVFMAIPKTAGRNKRGNEIYYKTPQGELVLGDDEKPILDDQVPIVATEFLEWIRETGLAAR